MNMNNISILGFSLKNSFKSVYDCFKGFLLRSFYINQPHIFVFSHGIFHITFSTYYRYIKAHFSNSRK